MDNGSPACTGFFFFHLIRPLHNYVCPRFGDFICFNDGVGPPLGEYFILLSIFFSWSNLFKLTTTRKWQGDNVDTMKRREIEGSAGCFRSFDILSNSQASPARSSMLTCVSIPFRMKCEPAQIKNRKNLRMYSNIICIENWSKFVKLNTS